jgi:hypothetical protein
MAKNGKQNTTTGGSSDGSAPVHGLDELRATGGGTRQRQHPVAQAGFSISNFGTGPSADAYRQHAQAAAAAASAVNEGAPDGSGPAIGYDDLVAGRGGRPSGLGSSDPSSLEAQG